MSNFWSTHTGEELTTKITKGSSPRWQGFEYQKEGVLFITSENVRDGYLDITAPKYLPDAFGDKAKNSKLWRGDILINIVGASIGRVCTFNLEKVEANVNQAVCVFRVKSPHLPEFFLQYFQAPHVRSRLMGETSDSARPNLSLTDFREFEFEVPPVQEQRKIAKILRTWDEALEKLEALRAGNLRRRVWIRTQLFTGRTRLPGHTGEWREVALADVLTEHRLQGTGAEEVFSVSVHKGLINQIEHLGRSFAAAETKHYNRVLPGDIVYTKSPTGDFPLGIIKQSKIEQEVIVSPLYGVFTPETQALGVILDSLFESPLAVRNYLHPLVQKGAKNTIAITNRRFLEGKLCLPVEATEQEAIKEVVETSQAELVAIEAQIEVLTRQKRGLMQKLLTGEWRVNVEPKHMVAS